MISYLEHKEIDKKKWDETIALCGNVYAYSWYLDIVHPQWDALVLDDYQSLMPLTGGRKYGVNYLYQPYFVQQLGIFSSQSSTKELTGQFLQAIPKKFRFAEIRLNESNKLDNDSQGVEYHRNVLLDMNMGYDEIYSNYHKNTKRNLARATANRLQVVDTVIPSHVVALFRGNRGATLDKWGDAEYNLMTELATTATQKGNAFTVGVAEKSVSELLSAAIFVQANNRVTFLFSGLTQQGREKQAMTFLLDQTIRKLSNSPTTFDFEGSDDENLARFYLGFGGNEVHYPSYRFNRMTLLGNALLKVWKKRK